MKVEADIRGTRHWQGSGRSAAEIGVTYPSVGCAANLPLSFDD
jgi:hypothetical protein